MKFYYLFGKDACDLFNQYDLQTFLHVLKDNFQELNVDTFCYETEIDEPGTLFLAYQDWDGFTPLHYNEYREIRKLIKSL